MLEVYLHKTKKSYGNVELLHGIDLYMEHAEFTVRVGPSSFSKPTTLRMIAGLERVTSGEIYIDQKPVTKLKPKERGLAMVFQNNAFYPHMNVENNASFALRLETRPKKD